MTETAFPCIGCGACCLDIRRLRLPLPIADDGSCAHLAEDRRTCTIYDQRPSYCRVDLLRPMHIPTVVWHEVNLNACKLLRAHHGIPEPSPELGKESV